MAVEIPLQAGQIVNGFRIEAVTPLESQSAVVCQAKHEKSGARFVHVFRDDDENLFSINFPTPPPDDTGVPHIMEHTVLSGSKRFPIRDPFFELAKISMATFLNAMTGMDCTYYPVASNVKQDLFNLAEVYFDAVFHPLLQEEAFKREAYHLAPADPEKATGDLTYTGIVYNEMKGVFSNPEARLWRLLAHELFPDTSYSNESGGDPDAIPQLTYEDFRQFHQTYYHPSNAYIVTYGNIATTEYMAFLDDRLSEFNRADVDIQIMKQKRWAAPRQLEDAYPIGPDEKLSEKTYLTLAWVWAESTEDPVNLAALDILSRILLGHEAAPLKKALVDSHLGQDLLESGQNVVGLERAFGVGLKGSEPERNAEFVDLVLNTLTDLADSTFSADQVEAAFQQATYSQLEIGGHFPLNVLSRVLGAWIYDADPLTFLRMREHLDACLQRYQANPAYFNQLIRERLLNNPHRLGIVLKPDPEWQAKHDAEFAAKMRKVREQFTDAEAEQIAAEHQALEKRSGTPNPPEAVAMLPQLQVSDLPARPRLISVSVETVQPGVELLQNHVFANGISYLQLHMDLTGLPAELWPYLPYYMEAIRKMGAGDMNYAEMARRKATHTGGIGIGANFSTRADLPDQSVRGLYFSMKTLDGQIDPAMQVLRDLLFAVNPRDTVRLRDVVAQYRAHTRSMATQQGLDLAMYQARRGLHEEAYLNHVVYGLPQLALAQQVFEQYDAQSDELMRRIEAIRDFILAKSRMTASFTGSDAAFTVVKQTLGQWVEQMRAETVTNAPVGYTPGAEATYEGLAVPSQVSYCVQAFNAPHLSEPDSPVLSIGAGFIRHNYMLNEIRLKGNAYGGFCSYDSLRSELLLASYRDPHVTRTLRVYEGARQFVANADIMQEDINHIIISTVKDDERPIRPENATRTSLSRHLLGYTEEMRQQRYDRVKQVTAAEVKDALLRLFDNAGQQCPVCVVSNRAKLEEANGQLSRPLVITDVLVDGKK